MIHYLKQTVFVVLCLIIVPISAQVNEPAFVGTWKLLSIEGKSDTGEWITAPRFGQAKPTGILMYDDKGNFAVQITTKPRFTGWSAERPEMINGYIAYYGTYETNSRDGTVTHHRLSHSNADVANLSAVRYFNFSDDTLTLTLAPGKNLRLTWLKAQ